VLFQPQPVTPGGLSARAPARVRPEAAARSPRRNVWIANDGFAEGGYKQSGIGRLRGPLAITEFQEAKTVVHNIPPAPKTDA
jgi:betaine-aldehyde dehydrogenase